MTLQGVILLIGMFGALYGARAGLWLLRRWARKYPACRKCGYISRGLASPICPECGTDSRVQPYIPFGRPVRAWTALAIFAWMSAAVLALAWSWPKKEGILPWVHEYRDIDVVPLGIIPGRETIGFMISTLHVRTETPWFGNLEEDTSRTGTIVLRKNDGTEAARILRDDLNDVTIFKCDSESTRHQGSLDAEALGGWLSSVLPDADPQWYLRLGEGVISRFQYWSLPFTLDRMPARDVSTSYFAQMWPELNLSGEIGMLSSRPKTSAVVLVLTIFTVLWLAMACLILFLGRRVLKRQMATMNEVSPEHAAVKTPERGWNREKDSANPE